MTTQSGIYIMSLKNGDIVREKSWQPYYLMEEDNGEIGEMALPEP